MSLRRDIVKFAGIYLADCLKGKTEEVVAELLRIPQPQAMYATAFIYLDLFNKNPKEADRFWSRISLACDLRPGKQRNSDLFGHVATALIKLGEDKSAISTYFYWDSRCWKAIRRHIESDDCVLIKLDKRYPIASHRGTGKSINLRRTHAYAPQYKEKERIDTHFHMDIEVTYERSDNEYVEDEVSYTYGLAVPIGLEDDIDETEFKKRFDKWVEEMRVKRVAEAKEEHLPKLEELVKQFPDDAKRILKELELDV